MSKFADRVYEAIGTTLISELRLTNTGKFIFDCKKDEVSGKWVVVVYRRRSDAGSNRTAAVFNIDHHSIELMLNQSKYIEYIQNQLDGRSNTKWL